jgi:hypothetical protein
VSVLRGISTLMFFRLCMRAPRTLILLMATECKRATLQRRRNSTR